MGRFASRNKSEKIFEESYSKFLTSPKYVALKKKIKNSMRKTIYAIADSFNHSEFRPLGYEVSFGEIPAEEKNKISHRANALKELQKQLTKVCEIPQRLDLIESAIRIMAASRSSVEPTVSPTE
mgnify:CR=1 FL=1